MGLSKYLEELAQAKVSFDEVDFGCCLDVVNGTGKLKEDKTE